MKKDIYMTELDQLAESMCKIEKTPLNMFAMVVSLVNMNMRYEKIAFNPKISEHPYILTKNIISDSRIIFENLLDINFIENEDKSFDGFKDVDKEKKHKELFNNIWNRYDRKQFEEYIDRYEFRLNINKISDLIKQKRCVDFGCGNGSFCFALLRYGASSAVGVDFGEKSISYAQTAARNLGYLDNTSFKTTSVYSTGLSDNSFDFAVQNGVFHHLDDEDKAIKEVTRVLKKGGWFWYYTAGEGAISRDLSDISVLLLKDVPSSFIERVLDSMNISRNKIVHLMDLLSATYASTSWEIMTERLSEFGFGNFRRLTGGFPTDYDLDVIKADPYGEEKFGEGDLRILCQLIDK